MPTPKLQRVYCGGCREAVREDQILACTLCERDCCPACADGDDPFRHAACAKVFETEVKIFGDEEEEEEK